MKFYTTKTPGAPPVVLRKFSYLIKPATIIDLICILLITLFIYTGLNKLLDYENFKVQLGRSPFIEFMSGFIAATLPAGELLIALLLMIKRTKLPGLYLSFALMTAFTGYIALMLTYAPDLPCSCGGVLAEMSWTDHLYFNSIFTLLAMAGVLLQTKVISSINQ